MSFWCHLAHLHQPPTTRRATWLRRFLGWRSLGAARGEVRASGRHFERRSFGHLLSTRHRGLKRKGRLSAPRAHAQSSSSADVRPGSSECWGCAAAPDFAVVDKELREPFAWGIVAPFLAVIAYLFTALCNAEKKWREKRQQEPRRARPRPDAQPKPAHRERVWSAQHPIGARTMGASAS